MNLGSFSPEVTADAFPGLQGAPQLVDRCGGSCPAPGAADMNHASFHVDFMVMLWEYMKSTGFMGLSL